ncbi:MAG: hypothetical protein AAF799_31855 [Myxococcota bacterium]
MFKHALTSGFVPLLALTLGCVADPDATLERDGIDDDDALDEPEAEPTPPSGPDTLASDDEPFDVVTFCDPALMPPVPVNFASEMLITDLLVVEDPCRTTLTPAGACAPGTVGVWTFAELMNRMSGTVPTPLFVAEWLDTFETNQVVNGVPMPARPATRARIIDPWMVASGCAAGDPLLGAGACTLDMTQAPFRLLAMVNRVDMHDASTSEPGEFRFIFGAVDKNVATEPPLEATFIFEYKLPSALPITAWTNRLHDLRLWPRGSGPYRNHLQRITDDITMPGAEPGNPNGGSSIGQVRTNDVDLDFGSPIWKLREYTLQDVGRGPNAFALDPHTTHLTPIDALNTSVPLDGYLSAQEPAILNLSHSLPTTFLGGEVSAPMLWNETGAVGILPETRHLFGFATCSGCHTDETNTNFTHVKVRPAGVASTLSPFLGVSPLPAFPGSGNPAVIQNVPDPDSSTGLMFQYNEPWRRICEVRRILAGGTVPYTRPNGAH